MSTVTIVLPKGQKGKGGQYEVGSKVRLRGENFWRRVNSDGTLTRIEEPKQTLSSALETFTQNHSTQQPTSSIGRMPSYVEERYDEAANKLGLGPQLEQFISTSSYGIPSNPALEAHVAMKNATIAARNTQREQVRKLVSEGYVYDEDTNFHKDKDGKERAVTNVRFRQTNPNNVNENNPEFIPISQIDEPLKKGKGWFHHMLQDFAQGPEAIPIEAPIAALQIAARSPIVQRIAGATAQKLGPLFGSTVSKAGPNLGQVVLNPANQFLGYIAGGEAMHGLGNLAFQAGGGKGDYMDYGYNQIFGDHYDPISRFAFGFADPALWPGWVHAATGQGVKAHNWAMKADEGISNSAAKVKDFSTSLYNLKNIDNRQALSDLFQYVRKGQYQNKYSINPETNQVVWSSTIPEGNVSFMTEAIKRRHPRNGRAEMLFQRNNNTTSSLADFDWDKEVYDPNNFTDIEGVLAKNEHIEEGKRLISPHGDPDLTTISFQSGNYYPVVYTDLNANSQLLTPATNYFTSQVQPRFKNYGVTVENPFADPNNMLIYAHEMPYYKVKNGTAEMVHTNSNVSGGANNELAVVYTRAYDKTSTWTHEGISHLTDKYVPKIVQDEYQQIATIPTQLKENGFNWSTTDSGMWEEARATINEAREKMIRDGIDVNQISDSQVIQYLSQVNEYGRDYVRIIRALRGQEQKDYIAKIKNALIFLPLFGGIIVGANQQSYRLGGTLKLIPKTK